MKHSYKIVIGICCVVIFIGIFLANNTAVLAQGADTLLRPAIGEQKTLYLESLYFNFLDKVNSITYHVNPHPTYTPFFSMSQPVSAATKVVNADQMSLTSLPINHSLPALVDEGIWKSITQNLFPNQEVLAQTIYRPDATRPYALVSIVKMDMQKLGLGIQAGTYYPGGQRKMYGQGIVPNNIQKANTLVAAFNGGFQENDGAYGMTIGKNVYVPLRKNLPTLLLFANGTAQFATYYGQSFPNTVVATRQNGPYLIENGKITPFVESSIDTWGRTTTNSMYTWRSGIGITKNGNLIYAVGNSLVPQSLAKALLAAGAENAIQLDINPFWVRFIVYQSQGNGLYTFTSLLPNMQNSGFAYLQGYNKDFFYVYKK